MMSACGGLATNARSQAGLAYSRTGWLERGPAGHASYRDQLGNQCSAEQLEAMD
jgi:hypothetical protein